MLKGELIQDSEQIKKEFEEKSSNLPLFMYHNGKQFPVKVISFDSKGLIIKNVGRTDKDPRIITFTYDKKLYKFTFNLLGTNGNFEILQPTVMEALPASRILTRVTSERLYITNICNQSDIIKSITADSVRVSNILKSYSSKVRDKISNLELFIHERVDVRLKLLNDHDKIIFIPNKSNQDSVPKDCVPYMEYLNQLRNSKGMDRIVSEITIPLKFKGQFTFGYLSAQHDLPMDDGYLQIMNALAQNIKKEIFSQPIINESKEASLLAEANAEGFSIFHTNFANFGKLFTIGGIIVFDLCISSEEKIICRAVIRNIKPTEKQFRIGCQFFTSSEEELKIIHNFLKKYIPNLEVPEKSAEITTSTETTKKS